MFLKGLRWLKDSVLLSDLSKIGYFEVMRSGVLVNFIVLVLPPSLVGML